jgi:hypothetical protein
VSWGGLWKRLGEGKGGVMVGFGRGWIGVVMMCFRWLICCCRGWWKMTLFLLVGRLRGGLHVKCMLACAGVGAIVR